MEILSEEEETQLDSYLIQRISYWTGLTDYAIEGRTASRRPGSPSITGASRRAPPWTCSSDDAAVNILNYSEFMSRRLSQPEGPRRLQPVKDGSLCGPWYDLWADV